MRIFCWAILTLVTSSQLCLAVALDGSKGNDNRIDIFKNMRALAAGALRDAGYPAADGARYVVKTPIGSIRGLNREVGIFFNLDYSAYLELSLKREASSSHLDVMFYFDRQVVAVTDDFLGVMSKREIDCDADPKRCLSLARKAIKWVKKARSRSVVNLSSTQDLVTKASVVLLQQFIKSVEARIQGCSEILVQPRGVRNLRLISDQGVRRDEELK